MEGKWGMINHLVGEIVTAFERNLYITLMQQDIYLKFIRHVTWLQKRLDFFFFFSFAHAINFATDTFMYLTDRS